MKDYESARDVKRRFSDLKDGRCVYPTTFHLAVSEMPIMWKGNEPDRPWPKLEGDDKLFYDNRRRNIEKQYREFVAVRRNLCRIAYLATGRIIPINTNLQNYMIHLSHGLLTPPKPTITEFGAGSISYDAVTSFYTAFWRRVRFLKQHNTLRQGLWVPSRPVAVHAIRSAHVGEGFWFTIGQYNKHDQYSTSPEWHEWYAKWGKEATL